MPGPGLYFDETHTFGKEGQKITFGSKQQEKYTNYPGPGEYDNNLVQTNTTVKIGSSTRGDIVNKDSHNIPGPGLYSDETGTFGKEGVKYSMGQRGSDKINTNPGPGEYDTDHAVLKETNTSVRFGSSTRGDIVDKRQVDQPGPGEYYENTLNFGKDGVKVSISNSNSAQKLNTNPGPGDYDPTTQSHGPSTFIGSTRRTQNFEA